VVKFVVPVVKFVPNMCQYNICSNSYSDSPYKVYYSRKWKGPIKPDNIPSLAVGKEFSYARL